MGCCIPEFVSLLRLHLDTRGTCFERKSTVMKSPVDVAHISVSPSSENASAVMSRTMEPLASQTMRSCEISPV